MIIAFLSGLPFSRVPILLSARPLLPYAASPVPASSAVPSGPSWLPVPLSLSHAPSPSGRSGSPGGESPGSADRWSPAVLPLSPTDGNGRKSINFIRFY